MLNKINIVQLQQLIQIIIASKYNALKNIITITETI